jgi:hypothetical protein
MGRRWLNTRPETGSISVAIFFAAVVWLNSENVAGTAGANSLIKNKEGVAVDPLLACAGWNLAILSVSGRRPSLKRQANLITIAATFVHAASVKCLILQGLS